MKNDRLTSISRWSPTRAMNPSAILPMTCAVSRSDSFTPSWMSAPPRNMAFPPSTDVAVSLATRVRVDRLLNSIATVLPFRLVLTT